MWRSEAMEISSSSPIFNCPKNRLRACVENPVESRNGVNCLEKLSILI